MEIPDLFVDYDFTIDPNFVFGDLGRGDVENLCCGVYEDAVPSLTRAQIMGEIEAIDDAGGGAERLVTRIFNQGREGSCVGNATTQANEVLQAKKFGRDAVIPLSPISSYKQYGRSASSGAMISDALQSVCNVGILPLDTPENRAKFGAHVMPATGFSTPFPSGWQTTAAKFKGGEYHVVRTVDGLLTALVNQDPVVVGREGHSICYLRPMIRNGQLGVVYANSWSEQWGFGAGHFKGGFGFDTLAQVTKSAGWAFVLRSVVTRET